MVETTGGSFNSPQMEINEFLMDHLPEICEIIDDPAVRAYGIVTTLSAVGDSIQESLLKIYIDPILNSCDFFPTLAAFMGMDILKIDCDCTHPVYGSCLYHKLLIMPEFETGLKLKATSSYEYCEAMHFVSSLREAL